MLRISADLELPADAVTSTLIVFGGKGMGKTNLGGVLVEELSAASLRWCVLDPLGVWWGLRHSADGKGKGIECLILGGVNGDIPIEPTGGAVVADLVVDEDADVIVDFSRRPDGRMWSKGERIRFVTDYAVRLFQRQGELVEGRRRPPLFVVLDEAARYIPQAIRAGDKDIAMCVSAWEDLVEEGRNVGIGVGLLTQRSARINKSVSELADALFAFRTVGPLSVGAIVDWLGEHVAKERIRELVERIRALNVGDALVVSPGWLRFEDVVHIRARHTFDSSATPKAGEARRVSGDAAKPDLAKYQARMAETIERAKANDPSELRRRIQQLERDAAQRPTETPIETVEKIVEVPVLNGQVEKLATLLVDVRQYGESLVHIGDGLVEVAHSITAAIDRVQPRPHEAGQVERGPRGVQARPAGDRGQTAVATLAPAASSRKPVPDVAGPASLSKADKALLTALVQFPAGLSKVRLSLISGYSVKSSSFANALGALRSAGFVEKGSDPIRATEAGIAAVPDAPPAPMRAEILDYWRARLGKAERAFLDAIVDAWPVLLSKEELSERTGYSATSSSFANALGRLRSLELLDGFQPAEDLV